MEHFYAVNSGSSRSAGSSVSSADLDREPGTSSALPLCCQPGAGAVLGLQAELPGRAQPRCATARPGGCRHAFLPLVCFLTRSSSVALPSDRVWRASLSPTSRRSATGSPGNSLGPLSLGPADALGQITLCSGGPGGAVLCCWLFNSIHGLCPPEAPSPGCDSSQKCLQTLHVSSGAEPRRVLCRHPSPSASPSAQRPAGPPSCPGGLPGPSLVPSPRPTQPGPASCSPLLHLGPSSLCWTASPPDTPPASSRQLSCLLGELTPQYTQISVTCHLGMAFPDHSPKVTLSCCPLLPASARHPPNRLGFVCDVSQRPACVCVCPVPRCTGTKHVRAHLSSACPPPTAGAGVLSRGQIRLLLLFPGEERMWVPGFPGLVLQVWHRSVQAQGIVLHIFRCCSCCLSF